MTTTSPLNTTASSGLNLTNLDPSLQAPATQKNRTTLDQEAFLKLMIEQFRNQDPTKPQDPSEFLSQLAQFSSVTGIGQINTAIGKLTDAVMSNQALQASSIVGKDVLTQGDTENLADGRTFTGAVDLPVASDTGFVQVYDDNGVLVRQLPLGSRAAGLAQFTWDGKSSTGTQLPAGTYHVLAGYTNGNQVTQATTYVASRVASVAVGGSGQGTLINTDTGGQIALADVKAIL